MLGTRFSDILWWERERERDPGMVMTPFPSCILERDSNPQPYNRESNVLTTRRVFFYLDKSCCRPEVRISSCRSRSTSSCWPSTLSRKRKNCWSSQAPNRQPSFWMPNLNKKLEFKFYQHDYFGGRISLHGTSFLTNFYAKFNLNWIIMSLKYSILWQPNQNYYQMWV